MRGSSTDRGRGSAGLLQNNPLLQINPSLRIIFFACGVLSIASALVPAAITAQESAVRATTSAGSNDKPKTERNLIARTGWMRLEIVGGRIAVLGHRCGQSRIVQVGEPSELPYEQLSVQLHTESLIIHYEDLRTDRQIKLDLDDQQRLVLTRTADSPTGEIKLVQPFRGPLTLTIGRDAQQTFTGATIWHLALQQPTICEESLFPLLETLRPHWGLGELATGIRKDLLSQAGRDVLTERAQWREWLKKLDSDDFQERQDADHQLRTAGQGVVAWLQRIDRKQLTPEQVGRVQDICQGLADLSTDTPQRVAAWLVDDRCAWFALLRSDDLQTRIDATNHLSLLFGKPLAFNPVGQLSDREVQIVQLQKRFGK